MSQFYRSMTFLALLVVHHTTSALPISSSMSILWRRINPGSYAIITPTETTILYDSLHDVYFACFKFGDGKEDREEAYDTHNPSFTYTYAPSGDKQKGDEMMKLTLDKLARKYEAITNAVEQVLNSHNHKTEWFRIYLGKDKVVAMKSKAKLHQLAKEYSEADRSSEAKRKEFAAQFVIKLEAILKPKDQSKAASQDEASNKEASKDPMTATDTSSKTPADTPPTKEGVIKAAGDLETETGASSGRQGGTESSDGTKAKPSVPKSQAKQPKKPGGTGRITRARKKVEANDKQKQT